MAEEGNRVQELLREMNEGGDETSTQTASTETSTSNNEPPAGKETKPAATAKPEKPSEETTDENDNNNEPLFLQKPKEEAKPAAQAKPADEEIPTEKVFAYLSKSTSGAIKNEKELIGFVNSYNQLVKEAEEGWQPKYANERAKRVHELLLKSAGSEPAEAIRVLRAIQFNPEGKTPKEVLFQAYLQDPANADLTELTAKDYFEAEYDTKYDLLNKPDEELTPDQKRAKLAMQREQQLAVRNAQASIKKMQDDFTAADEGPKEVDKQVTEALTKAVGGFNGLKLAFTDNPQETEYLNVPFADPEAKQALLEEILNPDGAYNEMVEQFRGEDGKMDWNALTKEAFERKNHKELRKQAFEHGLKMGQLQQINKIKNSTNPKDISRTGVPAAGEGPKSWQDAFKTAIREKNGY